MNAVKRLLCCSGSLEGGGSERQLWQLAMRIDRTRFQPLIYLLRNSGIYLSQLSEDVPVRAYSSETSAPRFYLPGQTHRRQVQHLARVLREEAIDIVYDRTFHMTLATAPACRRTRTPRVSVIVSPPSQDFAHSHERFAPLKRLLLARAYRDRGSTVVAVSEAVADDVASFYRVPRPRIQVVANPVDVAAIQAAAGPRETSGQLTKGHFTVVVVGRLSTEKGQHLLLDSLGQFARTPAPGLPRLKVQFIGEGPDRPELQRKVQEFGLENCVEFLGYLANPYPWMQQADLLCLPSLYEGLPNAALEAMALKTPILATDCSASLRQLLGDGQRGVLVPLGDPARLWHEIEDCMRHPQAWRDRAEEGYRWVCQQHDLSSWLEQMQELFEGVQ